MLMVRTKYWFEDPVHQLMMTMWIEGVTMTNRKKYLINEAPNSDINAYHQNFVLHKLKIEATLARSSTFSRGMDRVIDETKSKYYLKKTEIRGVYLSTYE